MTSIEGTNVADLVVRNFGDIGYKCTHALVNAKWFGVPQERHRLIFIATRHDLLTAIEAKDLKAFAGTFCSKFAHLNSVSTVRQAIGDLPRLTSGAAEDPLSYSPKSGRPSNYAALMRTWSNGVLTDHVCRKHNEQDLEAFAAMRQGMQYFQLDQRFKRYRDDIFPDKYKKLYWDRPSWTVTAHLSKDCYTHIHPSQARTVSVREAARLQSFPDDFRFFGNIGDRFRQIGNAIPPLMAWGIAEFIKMKVRMTK